MQLTHSALPLVTPLIWCLHTHSCFARYFGDELKCFLNTSRSPSDINYHTSAPEFVHTGRNWRWPRQMLPPGESMCCRRGTNRYERTDRRTPYYCFNAFRYWHGPHDKSPTDQPTYLHQRLKTIGLRVTVLNSFLQVVVLPMIAYHNKPKW